MHTEDQKPDISYYSFAMVHGLNHGTFNISQDATGAIILSMNDNFIILSYDQIYHLKLEVKQLINFDEQLFNRYYFYSTAEDNSVILKVREIVEDVIDNAFIEIHTQTKTTSGDISPQQQMMLDRLNEEYVLLILSQVTGNNPFSDK